MNRSEGFRYFMVYADLFSGVKVMRLKRTFKSQLQSNAAICGLFRLWAWCSTSCPNGDLNGMDIEEIEAIADWEGEAGEWVRVMTEVGFLDQREDSGREIHDWLEHQPYMRKVVSGREAGIKSGEVRRRSGEGQGKVTGRSGEGQGKVTGRSGEGQGKERGRSGEGQGKERGTDESRVEERRGEDKSLPRTVGPGAGAPGALATARKGKRLAARGKTPADPPAASSESAEAGTPQEPTPGWVLRLWNESIVPEAITQGHTTADTRGLPLAPVEIWGVQPKSGQLWGLIVAAKKLAAAYEVSPGSVIYCAMRQVATDPWCNGTDEDKDGHTRVRASLGYLCAKGALGEILAGDRAKNGERPPWIAGKPTEDQAPLAQTNGHPLAASSGEGEALTQADRAFLREDRKVWEARGLSGGTGCAFLPTPSDPGYAEWLAGVDARWDARKAAEAEAAKAGRVATP